MREVIEQARHIAEQGKEAGFSDTQIWAARAVLMSSEEQLVHAENCLAIRSALSALRLTRVVDEDIEAAKARLENWLTENDGRWTK